MPEPTFSDAGSNIDRRITTRGSVDEKNTTIKLRVILLIFLYDANLQCVMMDDELISHVVHIRSLALYKTCRSYYDPCSISTHEASPLEV